MKHAVTLFLCAALLAGCGTPVPPEKTDYVGEWHAKTMYLLITQDGSIYYKRLNGGITKEITAPLKRFEGDNFVVGVGPFSTTFVVNRPPFRDGASWKMTVDGLELTKSDYLEHEVRL